MPPVLLFAHGAGFCKEIWAPIIRHMQQSALLQNPVGVEFVSVDLPFHGSNRDNSVVAQVDEKGPHVTHPANNAIAVASVALLQTAERLNSGGRPVIGIGHSMGAAALWKAEITSPGTFRALGTANAGRPEPPSREAATSFFENWKSFSSWDRESLACWMQGAIVPDESDDEAVVLACHPAIEASIYCGGRLWLSEEEQAKTKCPTTFHSGSTSRLYRQEVFEDIASRHPKIFTVHAPMIGKSHLMVFEDPEGCAKAIVTDLDALGCFSTDARL
ncbi:hypothetical protein AM587_10009477 [Phytophthora nicotianae]|uniref:AB hydrolase-1 domain-containing protein n=1 Tax=Phytophthora nicotianae TaxID=4792 RepID=A0A0W8E0U1_PHYNI|nr:hypothetical protein AM587_10009477 [Phytophthora nicotianae]